MAPPPAASPLGGALQAPKDENKRWQSVRMFCGCLGASLVGSSSRSSSRRSSRSSRRRSRSLPEALGTLSGRSQDAPGQWLSMSFYVPGRSRSFPEALRTLSGHSQDAPGQCLSMSFYGFLCLPMSLCVFLCLSRPGTLSEPPGASRDALGTLPGRFGRVSFYVFLCLPMFFDVPGRFRSLPEAPGTLSGRSQDAPGLCLSMSLYARDALAASLRFPGRSRDAVRTLRDNVFLCLSMSFYVFLCLSMHSYVFLCPGTLFEPPRGSRDALGTLPRRSDTMSFYAFLCLSMSRDAL